MKILIESLSNREAALFAWLLLISIGFLCIKTIRQSFYQVLKNLFEPKIILIIILLLLYITIFAFLLNYINFWAISLLKDTILWTLGLAFPLLFQSHKIKTKSYFIELIKKMLKYIVVFEFVVNFYTFSLKTEIIIFPILLIAGLMQIVASYEHQYQQVENLIKHFFTLFSCITLAYVIYKTGTQYDTLLTMATLKSFVLPFILTGLLLPFIYFLALWTEYEMLFVRLKALLNDKSILKDLKYQIFTKAHLDIDRLVKISANALELTGSNSQNFKQHLNKIID